MPRYGPPEECWCCGDVRPVICRKRGGPLCTRCYSRWQRKGFSGPGPGPKQKPPVADSVQEYQAVITSLTARQAAARLGISDRTVQRWRAVLREAS
jgi:transposase-like protein